MRTEDFWAVIERAAAERPADPELVARRAVAELVTRPPEEIAAWGRHFDKVMAASYQEDLGAAAYLINGGCSDDGFDQFRGWLVAHGRAVVARAVREPDALADLPAVRSAAETGAEFAAHEMLSIADGAYTQVTGSPLPPPEDPIPAPALADFWDFDDEDEMRRRLPRLSALFLEPPH